MDLVRLGPPGATTYAPDMMIEGYNSLIWTERFQSDGEFEIKTYDVSKMMTLLPEFTFLSHLETKEIMMVETHSVDWEGEGADARPELTIKGRSATNIIDHRYVESTYQTKRRMRKKYSATSGLCVLLYNAIANTSGYDVTRVGNSGYPVRDALPNVVVSESVQYEGSLRWWMLEQGFLGEQFRKIMIDADLGIRTIRPVAPNPGTIVTVSTDDVLRGTVNRLYDSEIEELRFDIYEGLDRSSYIQFSQLQGHLDKPNYLRSIADLKTVVEIATEKIGINDVYREGESLISGWKRRATVLDFGKPEIPEAPKQPARLKTRPAPTAAQRAAYADAMDYYYYLQSEYNAAKTNVTADFQEEGRIAALAELKKASRIDMVAGDISSLSPYSYKTHYNLGDKVTLLGDYGPATTMIVQEYVRTEDANGDRGFPGLVVPGVV